MDREGRSEALGVPMGPDVLFTVRGRKSGLPRSTPITLCENDGRRGLISPFGETDWVRNLRAAGSATLTVGRRTEEVTAVELGPPEAAAFVRDVLAPHAGRSRLGSWFVRHVDKIDIDDPVEAAEGRPAFELTHRTDDDRHLAGRSVRPPPTGGTRGSGGPVHLLLHRSNPMSRLVFTDERRRSTPP